MKREVGGLQSVQKNSRCFIIIHNQSGITSHIKKKKMDLTN